MEGRGGGGHISLLLLFSCYSIASPASPLWSDSHFRHYEREREKRGESSPHFFALIPPQKKDVMQFKESSPPPPVHFFFPSPLSPGGTLQVMLVCNVFFCSPRWHGDFCSFSPFLCFLGFRGGGEGGQLEFFPPPSRFPSTKRVRCK